MLEAILQKSVSVSLANGVAVVGFVVEMDEEFIKVIEYDNSKVIVRKGDVSFVRVYEGIPRHLQSDTDDSRVITPVIRAPERDDAAAPDTYPTPGTYVIRGRGSQCSVGKNEYSMESPNSAGSAVPVAPKFKRQT